MLSFAKDKLPAFVWATVIYLIALCASSQGQQVSRPDTQQPSDDVIRIKTELVQTEVMVFDRRGRFVEGLTPNQFELSFNGSPRSTSFFEPVTAGSSREIQQVATARGDSRAESRNQSATESVERGRLIFFFIDDIHLSASSLVRGREALQKFVDDQMNANDQVAIVSASGQIGFFEQLTDNPAVLHAAISRLSPKPSVEAYTGKTQISEYLASQVLDYGNRELFAYLLESTKIEQQMGPGNRNGDHRLAASYSATTYLRNRLRQISEQSRMATDNTLDALENLILSSNHLPGRKLVFFLSDGFIVNERKTAALEMLNRISREAARSGTIIYTMDARGTTFNLGSAVDASTNDYIDTSARRAGLSSAEISASREPLKIIADETGGRAIVNSNSIGDGIGQAISETSFYYLLAWRPEAGDRDDRKHKLRITIKDRPDLKVRWRSDFSAPPEPNTKVKASEKTNHSNQADGELRSAVGSPYPQKALPLFLSAGYINSSEGELLKLTMQIQRQSLNLASDAQSQKAEVDVIGMAIDERGQFTSFKQLLTVGAPPASQQQAITWNQQLVLKPGVYQLRVGIRERSTGRMGSAIQWIEIPDTAARFALSSLFVAERKASNESAGFGLTAPQPITVDVNRRFGRSSVLRFQTYVYNAARSKDDSEVWIQAQVLRDRRTVMTVAGARVPNNADGARLPYWSEIPLGGLPAGQYALVVSATDRLGNRTASQSIKFSVE